MNFKTKVLGTLAALVMTMSLAAGALAQSSDSEPVHVELTDVLCGIDISIASGSLGTWAWNGNEYTLTSPSSTIEVDGVFTSQTYGACDVNVGFTGLTDATGTNHIPATTSYFAVYSYYGNGADRSPYGWSEAGVSGDSYDFRFKLVSVPTTIPLGVYSGTIKVDVANAV